VFKYVARTWKVRSLYESREYELSEWSCDDHQKATIFLVLSRFIGTFDTIDSEEKSCSLMECPFKQMSIIRNGIGQKY